MWELLRKKRRNIHPLSLSVFCGVQRHQPRLKANCAWICANMKWEHITASNLDGRFHLGPSWGTWQSWISSRLNEINVKRLEQEDSKSLPGLRHTWQRNKGWKRFKVKTAQALLGLPTEGEGTEPGNKSTIKQDLPKRSQWNNLEAEISTQILKTPYVRSWVTRNPRGLQRNNRQGKI